MLKIKLRFVYLPILSLFVGSVIFYNLFRWFFDFKWNMLPICSVFLDIWLPLLLCVPLSFFFLRKRVRILIIKDRSGGNGRIGHLIGFGLFIGFSIVASQYYIDQAYYILKEVNQVDEVKIFSREKYFKIDNFHVNMQDVSHFWTSETSGRNNSTLRLLDYYAFPFNKAKNSWCCFCFSKSTSNNLSKEEKDVMFDNLLESSKKKLDQFDFSKVKYFERISESDDQIGYRKAIRDDYRLIKEENIIFLDPNTIQFEDRKKATFYRMLIAFGISLTVILLMVLIPKINEEELEIVQKKKTAK